MRVDAELRYNLFLALKETLNNVVKHAKATEVWLRLRIEPKAFVLIIEDNGQGLPDAGGKASPALVRNDSPPAPAWSIYRNALLRLAVVATSTASPAREHGWK